MRRKFIGRALAALAGGSVLATAGMAGAAQTCTAGANVLGDANTVFIAGSSAVQSLLQHLAYILYVEATATSTQPVKIVYVSDASCQGVEDIITATADLAMPAVFIDGSQGTMASPVGVNVTVRSARHCRDFEH